MNSTALRKKQVEALQKNDPYQFCTWLKEARLARRELAALYRAKEKHDEERARIQGIVRRLKSVGVNVDVVERCIILHWQTNNQRGDK